MRLPNQLRPTRSELLRAKPFVAPERGSRYFILCFFLSHLVRGTIVVFGCLVLSDLVRFFCRQIFSGFSLVSFSSHQYSV